MQAPGETAPAAQRWREVAATFGLQPLATDRDVEQRRFVTATQLSPVSPASADAAEGRARELVEDEHRVRTAQSWAEDPVESSDDSDMEHLRAAALLAEARRLPGPLPVASPAPPRVVAAPVRAAWAARRSADEPPRWALTALRSLDVAASVFRMLDQTAQESLAALNCRTRDALLVAACVDPQYWYGPSAALAAAALVAQRTVRQANAQRGDASAEVAASSGAASAVVAAAAPVVRASPAGPTARRWAQRLRAGALSSEEEPVV